MFNILMVLAITLACYDVPNCDQGHKIDRYITISMITMIHQQQALRFKCTGCGQCCRGGEDHYIAISPTEAKQCQGINSGNVVLIHDITKK